MEELLNKTITFKEPSLKRDDLLSVLDAIAKRQIFPKEIYEKTVNILQEILGLKNIILVSSKYVAIQLVLQVFGKKYNELYSANDTNAFYFNQFSGFFNKITPIDINQYYLFFNPEILTDLGKSILFFSYNLGYPVDIKFIEQIDIVSLADFSGSLFVKKDNRYLINNVDFAICSFKDEEIVTSGDGSLIYIKDDKIYDKIKNYAFNNNLFLSDFNCSLLMSQINKKDKIIDSRKKIFFNLYEQTKDNIGEVDWFDSRRLLEKWTEEELNKNASFTTFTLYANDISLAKSIATQMGVEIIEAINTPLSLELKLPKSFPVTEKIAKHAIFIPFYPLLDLNDLNRITFFMKKIQNIEK